MNRFDEEYFRGLFLDHSAIKIIVNPKTGSIVKANKAASKFYGWRIEQLEKMHIQEINILTDEEVKQNMNKVLCKEKNRFEFCHKKSNGSIVDVEVFCSCIKIQNEIFLHSIIHDITERKQAEKELIKNEKKFRQIYRNIQTGIARFSLKFEIMNANEAYCKMLGYTEKELIGKTLKEITHPETMDVNLKKQNDLKMGLVDSYSMEKKFIHKDGHTVHGLLNANLIRDEKGDPDFFIGSVVDITKRKTAEQTLTKREEKYRRITDNMTDVVWTANLDANLTFITPSIERLTGESVEENMKRSIMDRFTPKSLSQILPMIKAEFEKEKDPNVDRNRSRLIEGEQLRKDGSIVDVSMNISFLRDENGAPAGFLGITRDVTEQKNSEKEKEKLKEQLIQSQKMESIGRLAGGVAHDFNNMLSVILGRSEIALNKADPKSEISAELREIQAAAERSADLTAQLLAFARKQVVSPKVVSIDDEIKKITRMLKRLIGEDTVLILNRSKTMKSISIDPAQLSQILTNLCINAKDADAKTITIKTVLCDGDTSLDDRVQIIISDDGCGMDEETASKIFEPFFTTKQLGKGTGLGLSTIYGIVQQNNGSISVVSEVGNGTEFKICFPVSKGTLSKKKTEQKDVKYSPSGKTILLVEDEGAILEMIEMMLEEFGYNVFSANTPGKAVNLAAESSETIDLLLTDVVMPEMNGKKLAQMINTHNRDLKTVYMSGYTADVIANEGVLDEGMNFIQKPFSMKELRDKIENVLRAEQ